MKTAPINNTQETTNATPDIIKQMSSKDVGLYIPIVKEHLPSKGKFYNSKNLSARPLNVLELKALSTMNEENSEAIVDRVVRSCVSGIDFEQLLSADKFYLVFWLRANTFKNSDYNIEFDCPHCQSKGNKHTFSLGDIKIKSPEDDAVLDFVLPDCGDSVTLKYLTVKDEMERKDFENRNSKSMMMFEPSILDIVYQISSIGDKVGTIEKYQYVISMSPDDYVELETRIDEVGIGVEAMVDMKCAKCKGVCQSIVPFRPDFFLSKGRNK